MDPTTIAAIATATGSGGIGIVKISGARAVAIAQTIFRPARSGSHWRQTHRLSYGHIIEPASGRRVDEVLVSVMRGPFSYTGEDVVEINAHGGTAVPKRILELVLAAGARLAEPGEFTRRAFVNGRIDLTQAEAVIDIVMAKTVSQQRLAMAQLDGRLRQMVTQLRLAIMDTLVVLEAAIDFPDDVSGADPIGLAQHLATDVLEPAQALCEAHVHGRVIREGIRLALVGRPNVGKSSLLNRLIDADRAIVTPYPGTTRDVIEETILVNGISVAVADTAGLHDTADPVETIGMARTLVHIGNCDMVLAVVDGGAARPDEDLIGLLEGRPLIVVINKIDTAGPQALAKTCACWHNYPQAQVSALTGAGIADLKATIVKHCLGKGLADTDRLVPALRHKLSLELVAAHAKAAIAGLKQDLPAEIVCLELQAARTAADRVLGIEAPPELLDEIFGRFCIGK